MPSHLSHKGEVLRQGIHPNLIYTFANSYEWLFSAGDIVSTLIYISSMWSYEFSRYFILS